MSTSADKPSDCANPTPLCSAEWYAARRATAALRDVLVTAGMEREFPYLRADVNAFGQGLVVLGRIGPQTAERLAELIALSLTALREAPTGDVHGEERSQ